MRSQKRVKRTSKCRYTRRKAHQKAAFIKERLDRSNWISTTMTAEPSKVVVHLAAVLAPKTEVYDKPPREKKQKQPKPKAEPQPTTSQKSEEKKQKKQAKIEKKQLEAQLEKKETKPTKSEPVPATPVIEQLAQTSEKPQPNAKSKGKNKKEKKDQEPNASPSNEEALKRLNEELRVDVEQTSNLHNGVQMKSSVDSGVDVQLYNDSQPSKSPDKASSNESSISEVPEIDDIPKTPTSTPAEYQDQTQREPSREADFAINVPKTPTSTPAEFQDPFLQQHQTDFSQLDSLKFEQGSVEEEEKLEKIEVKQNEQEKPSQPDSVMQEDDVELAQEALPDEDEVKEAKAGKSKKNKKEKKQVVEEKKEEKPVEEVVTTHNEEAKHDKKNKKDKKQIQELVEEKKEVKPVEEVNTTHNEETKQDKKNKKDKKKESESKHDKESEPKQEKEDIEEPFVKLSHVLGNMESEQEKPDEVVAVATPVVEEPAKDETKQSKKNKKDKKHRESQESHVLSEQEKPVVEESHEVVEKVEESKKGKKDKKQRKSESEVAKVAEEVQEPQVQVEEGKPTVHEVSEEPVVVPQTKKDKKKKGNQRKSESETVQEEHKVTEEPVAAHAEPVEEKPAVHEVNEEPVVHQTKKDKKKKGNQRKSESETVQEEHKVTEEPAHVEPLVQENHHEQEPQQHHHKRGNKKNKKNRKSESENVVIADEVQEAQEDQSTQQDLNGWAEVPTTKKNKKNQKSETIQVAVEAEHTSQESPASPIEGQTPEETAKVEAAAPQPAEQPNVDVNGHAKQLTNGFHGEPSAEDLEVAHLAHNGVSHAENEKTKFAQSVAHLVDHVQHMLHDDIHSTILTSTVHSASSKAILYKIDPIQPLLLPERRVDSPRVRYRRLLAKDVHFLAKMMEKYGEDYESMAKDPENFIHDSARGLQRKMRIFKESPQFDEYLQARAEGRPIESVQ